MQLGYANAGFNGRDSTEPTIAPIVPTATVSSIAAERHAGCFSLLVAAATIAANTQRALYNQHFQANFGTSCENEKSALKLSMLMLFCCQIRNKIGANSKQRPPKATEIIIRLFPCDSMRN